MTIQPVIIKIPGERADQLKRLADSQHLSMADTIAKLLNQEIEADRLDDALLGLAVKCVKDGRVELNILGIGSLTTSTSHAAEFADALDTVADRRLRGVFNVDAGVIVSSVGPAVKIKATNSEKARILAPSVARDFAKLIRKTLKA